MEEKGGPNQAGGASFSTLKRRFDGFDDHQLLQIPDDFMRNPNPDILPQGIPSPLTVEDIARELAPEADVGTATPGRLRAIRICLRAWERAGENARPAALQSIADFVARAIAPIFRPEKAAQEEELESEDDTDDGTSAGQDGFQTPDRRLSMANEGLSVLLLTSKWSEKPLGPQVFYTVVACALHDAPLWTTATRHVALQIIDQQMLRRDKSAFIIEDLLKSYIIPLFSKARPATITASGRKAAFPDEHDVHRGLELETPHGKPWKFADLRAVPVFSWALNQSGEDLVGEQWPLFTPVILTLLDDMDTGFRLQGLKLAQNFISRLEPSLLRATGLGEVFTDAIMPTLLFLPSLTPVEASVKLTSVAYRTLSELVKKLPSAEAKEKLIDKIFREGVFAGYVHAGDYHLVVGILAREAGRLARGLGIPAVKHLKDLVPMFSAILTDPFAMSHPGTLAAAITALQDIVFACWPRLSGPPWDGELLKMLVVCWLNVLEDEGDLADDGVGSDEESPRKLLVVSANQLISVWKAAEVDVNAKIGPLTAKDGRLAGLFAGIKSPKTKN